MSAGEATPDPVTIAAERPDSAEVLELFRLADVYGRSLYPAESYHALELGQFDDPRVTLLVARARGRALGTAALVLPPGDDEVRWAELKRMFVHPDARGLGVARALLGAVETRAAEHGMTELRLETGPPQLAAIALYERSGYLGIAPFGPYLGDPHSLCFAKPLGGR